MHEQRRERAWKAAKAAATAAVAIVIMLATAASYRLGAACALAGAAGLLLARRKPRVQLERLAAPTTGQPTILQPAAPAGSRPWLRAVILVVVAAAGVVLVLVFTTTRRQAIRPEAAGGSDTTTASTPLPAAVPIDSLVIEFSPSDRRERVFRQRTIAYAGCGVPGRSCAGSPARRSVVGEVASVPRGFLVREVHTAPACPAVECPPARVRVFNLPAESFLAAENVTPPQSGRYFESESVTWSQLEREAEVRFAVLPPPYPMLRPVLGPFIGLSGAGAWAGALFALALALILYVVTKVAGDAVTDWVKRHLGRRRPPRAEPEAVPPGPELQPHGEAQAPKKHH